MKITILTYTNPWLHSSANSNRILSLLSGLIKYCNNIEILVCGPYLRDQEEKKLDGKRYHSNIRCEYLSRQVLTGYLGIRFNNYFRQHFIPWKIKKLAINKCVSSDIIWLDSSIFTLSLAGKLKKELPRAKLFVEQNEFLDIHQLNKGNFLQRWQGNKRQKLFEKDVFPILDGLALMTRTLYRHYEGFPNSRPRLFHLLMTVDLERFENNTSASEEFQKPYIAFVGAMNDAKDGVSVLLESFAELVEEFSAYKLYLVGGWNYDTPAHLNFIKDRRLENRIFWMKEYPRDRIPAIIGNADLLVLPRPDSKQAQGGFPTKLGEYLATGNPVCATSVGEIPDYLNDNESVFFAQPGSVESFAEAMRRALSDPEHAKRVGLNGKKVAQKEFNKDIQAKKLHQFLLELQANKR